MANRTNDSRDDERTRDNGGDGFEEQGTRGREHDRGWGVDRPQGQGYANPERDYGWGRGRSQEGRAERSYGASQGYSAGDWRETGFSRGGGGGGRSGQGGY